MFQEELEVVELAWRTADQVSRRLVAQAPEKARTIRTQCKLIKLFFQLRTDVRVLTALAFEIGKAARDISLTPETVNVQTVRNLLDSVDSKYTKNAKKIFTVAARELMNSPAKLEERVELTTRILEFVADQRVTQPRVDICQILALLEIKCLGYFARTCWLDVMKKRTKYNQRYQLVCQLIQHNEMLSDIDASQMSAKHFKEAKRLLKTRTNSVPDNDDARIFNAETALLVELVAPEYPETPTPDVQAMINRIQTLKTPEDIRKMIEGSSLPTVSGVTDIIVAAMFPPVAIAAMRLAYRAWYEKKINMFELLVEAVAILTMIPVLLQFGFVNLDTFTSNLLSNLIGWAADVTGLKETLNFVIQQDVAFGVALGMTALAYPWQPTPTIPITSTVTILGLAALRYNALPLVAPLTVLQSGFVATAVVDTLLYAVAKRTIKTRQFALKMSTVAFALSPILAEHWNSTFFSSQKNALLSTSSGATPFLGFPAGWIIGLNILIALGFNRKTIQLTLQQNWTDLFSVFGWLLEAKETDPFASTSQFTQINRVGTRTDYVRDFAQTILFGLIGARFGKLYDTEWFNLLQPDLFYSAFAWSYTFVAINKAAFGHDVIQQTLLLKLFQNTATAITLAASALGYVEPQSALAVAVLPVVRKTSEMTKFFPFKRTETKTAETERLTKDLAAYCRFVCFGCALDDILHTARKTTSKNITVLGRLLDADDGVTQFFDLYKIIRHNIGDWQKALSSNNSWVTAFKTMLGDTWTNFNIHVTTIGAVGTDEKLTKLFTDICFTEDVNEIWKNAVKKTVCYFLGHIGKFYMNTTQYTISATLEVKRAQLNTAQYIQYFDGKTEDEVIQTYSFVSFYGNTDGNDATNSIPFSMAICSCFYDGKKAPQTAFIKEMSRLLCYDRTMHTFPHFMRVLLQFEKARKAIGGNYNVDNFNAYFDKIYTLATNTEKTQEGSSTSTFNFLNKRPEEFIFAYNPDDKSLPSIVQPVYGCTFFVV